MSDLSCIRFAEIARTVNPEAVPELQLHLGSCPSCQAQWAATKQAIAAAKQIPYEAPSPEDRMKIRNALMFNVGRPSRRTTSRRCVQAAAGVAVILGAAGVFAAVNSIVIPWLKARNEPIVERKTPTLVVPKPEPAVVSLPSIEDSIAKPSLKAADKGVRRPAPVHKAQAAAPAPEPPAVPAPAPEARTPSAAEQAYAEGWEAMRASNYARAAEAMKRAAEASTSTLAVDARYWEAVALARQGQAGKARAAMESFLRRYPGSPRLGEISVMLGWILVEAQEWSRAEQLFRSAENDRAPSVRDSARKGLEIVSRVQARTKSAP